MSRKKPARAMPGHPKSCRCRGNAWLYPKEPAPGVPMVPVRCPGTGTSDFLKPGAIPGDIRPSGQELAGGPDR